MPQKPKMLGARQKMLLSWICEEPFITLSEIKEELKSQGYPTSSSISTTLASMASNGLIKQLDGESYKATYIGHMMDATL